MAVVIEMAENPTAVHCVPQVTARRGYRAYKSRKRSDLVVHELTRSD